MGLEVIGILSGSHATIFKKLDDREPNLSKIKFYEILSRILFLIIETSKSILRPPEFK